MLGVDEIAHRLLLTQAEYGMLSVTVGLMNVVHDSFVYLQRLESFPITEKDLKYTEAKIMHLRDSFEDLNNNQQLTVHYRQFIKLNQQHENRKVKNIIEAWITKVQGKLPDKVPITFPTLIAEVVLLCISMFGVRKNDISKMIIDMVDFGKDTGRMEVFKRRIDLGNDEEEDEESEEDFD